jgi:hypothetical protein
VHNQLFRISDQHACRCLAVVGSRDAEAHGCDRGEDKHRAKAITTSGTRHTSIGETPKDVAPIMNIRSILPAALFALVWVAAALLMPTTTYHLAPVIVAMTTALRSPARARVVSAVSGVALAAATAVALSVSGNLGGPSLLPAGGALLESIVGALVGGIAGTLLAGRLEPTVSGSRP